MMMKIAGAALVMGASSLWGVISAGQLRSRYRQMQYLRKFIYRMRSEILYARSYLGEAFRQVSVSLDEPYQKWLLAMAEQMNKRNGQTFQEIWERETKEMLKNTGLPENILEHLSGLGGQLDCTDVEMQVRTLDLYLEELDLSIKEQYEEMKTKVRLYHCLGVMGGIFVTILLI